MKKLWLAAAVTAVLAAGCAEKETVDTIDNNEMPEELIVEVLSPGEAVSNEEVKLEAKVTQGDKAVDDAAVEFEVWESGLREEGEMVEGELSADGIYTADYTFDKDGVYYMYAHTTAGAYHVMPKHKFIIGTPDMSKVLEDDSSSSMEHMNHEKDSEDEASEGHH